MEINPRRVDRTRDLRSVVCGNARAGRSVCSLFTFMNRWWTARHPGGCELFADCGRRHIEMGFLAQYETEAESEGKP
jgi:hypothetical protein